MNGTLPEPLVGKRRSQATPTPADEPGYVRVEFLAPPEWKRAAEAAAKKLGMSLSAYIRMSCNRQMSSDRRDDPED